MKLTANTVTILRIVLLPLPCALFAHDNTLHKWIAFLLLVGLGCTDFVDGALARAQGPTRLGAILDPAADKIFTASVVLLYLAHGMLHPALGVLILGREFMIIALRGGLLARGHELPVSAAGKLKTIFQMGGFGTMFLTLFAPTPWSTLIPLTLATVFATMEWRFFCRPDERSSSLSLISSRLRGSKLQQESIENSHGMDSRLRGLPKSTLRSFLDEKPLEGFKMDSRLRGNDKVGGSASNVDENESPTKKHTLLLSFLRKQESTEKALNSRLTNFLEGPLRGNDKRHGWRMPTALALAVTALLNALLTPTLSATLQAVVIVLFTWHSGVDYLRASARLVPDRLGASDGLRLAWAATHAVGVAPWVAAAPHALLPLIGAVGAALTLGGVTNAALAADREAVVLPSLSISTFSGCLFTVGAVVAVLAGPPPAAFLPLAGWLLCAVNIVAFLPSAVLLAQTFRQTQSTG